MSADIPTARTDTDTPHALRARLRHLCDVHGVPVEQRARLVLSATTLAGSTPEAAVTWHLDHGTTLVITLHVPAPVGTAIDLPLPPETTTGTDMTWRLTVPEQPAVRHTGATDDDTATRQELRAMIARADMLERQHRDLKHELAETNSGVVAMYVELEERDERLRRAHAEIFRELEDALRPPAPTVPGVELGVHYQPAGQYTPTGGDLYDWFVLPDGTLHITVVDAVGHGVTSTRNAINVTHTVRTLAMEGHRLDDLVQRTARINPAAMATVLLARLDPSTGDLRLANGSHPPALLVRPDSTTYLPTPGRGIGFPDPGSNGVLTTRLAPGDLLLLYTDGLIESRGEADHDEVRLTHTARQHANLPVTPLVSAVVHDMLNAVRYTDDTLLLAVRYTGNPDPRHPPAAAVRDPEHCYSGVDSPLPGGARPLPMIGRHRRPRPAR
ncbi:PP2C family protein-serine/threonine phosphatase [Saccharothrix isguenensis]